VACYWQNGIVNNTVTGSADIAGVIALQAGIKYLKNIGWQNLKDHEQKLTKYAINSLKSEFGKKITIYGPSCENRAGIIAFSLEGVHAHDIAQILDEQNIAIRAGHHCAMPLHKRLGIPASARLSFHIYNDKEDVDKLVEGLRKVEKILCQSIKI